MDKLKIISKKDSLLFQKIFHNETTLQKHIDEYLDNEDKYILILQFKGHAPRIQDVAEDLRLLSWIPSFELGKEILETNPIRLISLHEQDWFLEALGAVSSAIAIYEFIIKRLKGKFPERSEKVREKVRHTRTRYRTVMQTVTRMIGAQQFIQQIPQQIPYEEEYFEEIESVKKVTVKYVNDIEITQIDQVIHRIQRIEIYNKKGEIRAVNFDDEKSEET